MTNKKPIIGICTRNMEKEFFLSVGAPTFYVDAIVRAGGIPLLMPLQTKKEDFGEMLDVVDGVIFTGGGDIAVDFYGGEMSEKVTLIDVVRDEFELGLAKEILKREMPVLGICRGLQLMNVAMGGTLFEDIPSQVENALAHSYVDGDAFDKLVHDVSVGEDSMLFDVFGEKRVTVNSLHHQSVRDLAEGLTVVATADDGVIESALMNDRDFGVLIQWHPECLPEATHAQQLFVAFVDAASKDA